jgi:hypothetical protein
LPWNEEWFRVQDGRGLQPNDRIEFTAVVHRDTLVAPASAILLK